RGPRARRRRRPAGRVPPAGRRAARAVARRRPRPRHRGAASRADDRAGARPRPPGGARAMIPLHYDRAHWAATGPEPRARSGMATGPTGPTGPTYGGPLVGAQSGAQPAATGPDDRASDRNELAAVRCAGCLQLFHATPHPRLGLPTRCWRCAEREARRLRRVGCAANPTFRARSFRRPPGPLPLAVAVCTDARPAGVLQKEIFPSRDLRGTFADPWRAPGARVAAAFCNTEGAA